MFQYAVIQLLFSLGIVKINKVYVFPAVLQEKSLVKRLLLFLLVYHFKYKVSFLYVMILL